MKWVQWGSCAESESHTVDSPSGLSWSVLSLYSVGFQVPTGFDPGTWPKPKTLTDNLVAEGIGWTDVKSAALVTRRNVAPFLKCYSGEMLVHKFLCRRECANLLSTPFPRFSCSEGKPVPEAEVICNCFYIVCLGALFGESISATHWKSTWITELSRLWVRVGINIM